MSVSSSTNLTEQLVKDGAVRTPPQRILTAQVRHALAAASMGLSDMDPTVLDIRGMSGRKYRMFINNLIRGMDDARYLEVGTWAGSTLCSAISGNSVRAIAIDNWSEFGGPKDVFQENLKKFSSAESDVRFIESDFRKIDFGELGKFNVYLFDGPHSEQDQYDGIKLALPALDECFVLIIDDWNWERVRLGTARAIRDLGLEALYSVEIRSTLDNSHPTVIMENSDWHNGYFIAVLRKMSEFL
jgi:predicted O-methyltransferase YrrM